MAEAQGAKFALFRVLAVFIILPLRSLAFSTGISNQSSGHDLVA